MWDVFPQGQHTEAVVQRKFRLVAIRREMDLGGWVDSKELHGG